MHQLYMGTACGVQTEEEQRERHAFQAGMQQLPAGVQAQVAHQAAGVCHVCYVEDYSDDNLLLEVSLMASHRYDVQRLSVHLTVLELLCDHMSDSSFDNKT